MKLMHYAAKEVKEVESKAQRSGSMDGPMGKPFGFWLSVDDDPETSWKGWCEGEEFRLSALAYEHEVTLRGGAKILYIRTQMELQALTMEYKIGLPGIEGNPYEHTFNSKFIYNLDWERIAKQWQGIIITPYIWECRLAPDTTWYYGWDCASGCIWDAEAIESIKLVRINEKYKHVVERTLSEMMAEVRTTMADLGIPTGPTKEVSE